MATRGRRPTRPAPRRRPTPATGGRGQGARRGPRPTPRPGRSQVPSRRLSPVASRRTSVAVAFAALALGLLAAGWATTEPDPPARPADPNPPTAAAREEIPPAMLARYRRAAAEQCPGLPWNVLAGIGAVETDHHRNKATSSAGALGPMQFMPATWDAFGQDEDGDGTADVLDPDDAVPAAARYLCTSDGDDVTELRQAIWDYNHADWYVDRVLAAAARYGELPDIPPRR